VTPIRTAANTALKAIKAGSYARAIAITPDGKAAYVANMDSGLSLGTVTPIRTAGNTALKAIKVGENPGPIAITPDGRTAYVANESSDRVTPIRTAANTALKAIRVAASGTVALWHSWAASREWSACSAGQIVAARL